MTYGEKISYDKTYLCRKYTFPQYKNRNLDDLYAAPEAKSKVLITEKTPSTIADLGCNVQGLKTRQCLHVFCFIFKFQDDK